MDLYADCILCNQRQVQEIMRSFTDDEDLIWKVSLAVADAMSKLPRQTRPAQATSIAFRIMREMTGVDDPLREMKRRHNAVAVGLYPELKAMVRESPDPLLMAVYVAVAGNIIDVSTMGIGDLDVRAEVERVLKKSLTIDHYAFFREDVKRAQSILFVGDNAGEVVFDRVLVEEIGPDKITYVVKGGPIINDATLEDALAAGMDQVTRVITTGDNSVGVDFELASPEFMAAYQEAALVISKGQGNFESFSVAAHHIYFLLQAKCAAVAREFGVPRGSLILMARDGRT
jgi:uncharacterized protein with ATP-grasp and redox domains